MWHEFKKCWKGNWKQSVPAGVLFCTLLAMECIAAWYYTVSYTHLDVYKRQHYCCTSLERVALS